MKPAEAFAALAKVPAKEAAKSLQGLNDADAAKIIAEGLKSDKAFAVSIMAEMVKQGQEDKAGKILAKMTPENAVGAMSGLADTKKTDVLGKIAAEQKALIEAEMKKTAA
jgi:flagellar motility protein MotE (MotC chaperone)